MNPKLHFSIRLITLLALASLAFAQNNVARSITVSGQGLVSVTPDTARLSIGIETIDRDASDALTENNDKMSQLIKTLKDAGIADEDVQTQGLSIYSRYPQASIGSSNNPNYTVNNTLLVRVRDLTALGGILNQLVADGANRLNGLQFQASDTSEALSQAREAAVADARSKAEQLASLTGARLGQVISIQESSANAGAPAMVRSMSLESSSVPIEAGSESISVSIVISWELE